MKKNNIYLFLLFLIVSFSLFCGISPRPDRVDTVTDEATWRSIRNEAISVSDNSDAYIFRTLTIVVGSDTADGSNAQKLNIASIIKSGTMVRYVTVYTNADSWFRLVGTGINATTSGAGADSTAKTCVRAGKSETYYAPNLSAITFYPNGTSLQTVDIKVGCARIKEQTPTQ